MKLLNKILVVLLISSLKAGYSLGQEDNQTTIDPIRLQLDRAVTVIDSAVYIVETYQAAWVNSKLSAKIRNEQTKIYDVLQPLTLITLQKDDVLNIYIKKLCGLMIPKVQSLSSNSTMASLSQSYKNVFHFAEVLFQDNNVREGQNFEEGLWLAYHMYRIRHEEVKEAFDNKIQNELIEKKRTKFDTAISKQLSINRLFKRPKIIDLASKYLSKDEIEKSLTNQSHRNSKRNLKQLIRQRKKRRSFLA